MNYFETLNAVDCNEFTEKKNGLTYLSWAHAWKELKKRFPNSFYTVYQNDLEWNYFSDNRYCWVKTGVTVVTEDGVAIEHIEYLPVMDYRNKSIPADMVTSFDVNKAIQRSLTKAVARHGLGLYIYAGEDLPDAADGSVEERKATRKAETPPPLILPAKPPTNTNISREKTIDEVIDLCDEKRYRISDLCERSGVDKLEDMTDDQLSKWAEWLRAK